MASEANGNSKGTPYILYHNYYSICSIMMRYLMKVRGEPANAASRMDVKEELIDIFNEEQLSEEYLLKVNPNGQVGSLVWTMTKQRLIFILLIGACPRQSGGILVSACSDDSDN